MYLQGALKINALRGRKPLRVEFYSR